MLKFLASIAKAECWPWNWWEVMSCTSWRPENNFTTYEHYYTKRRVTYYKYGVPRGER